MFARLVSVFQREWGRGRISGGSWHGRVGPVSVEPSGWVCGGTSGSVGLRCIGLEIVAKACPRPYRGGGEGGRDECWLQVSREHSILNKCVDDDRPDRSAQAAIIIITESLRP